MRATLLRHNKTGSLLLGIMSASTRCGHKAAKAYDRVVPRCMARPCVAKRISKSDERESCNNVLGLVVERFFAPDHHGYPRASRLTRRKTSKGHLGTQSRGCAGQTVRPSLHSISQTSVGKLSYRCVQSVFNPILMSERSGEAIPSEPPSLARPMWRATVAERGGGHPLGEPERAGVRHW